MLRWIWSKYEPTMLYFMSLIVSVVIGNWFQSSTYRDSLSHRSLNQLHQAVARENLRKWTDGRLETGRSFTRRTRSDSKWCKWAVFSHAVRTDECVLQALLLLQILTQSNANIQKIVAFENGFERLFEILVSEGGCRGGKSRCASLPLTLLPPLPRCDCARLLIRAVEPVEEQSFQSELFPWKFLHSTSRWLLRTEFYRWTALVWTENHQHPSALTSRLE